MVCTFNLAITNTFFRQKQRHKVTWIHPRSKHGHLIEFIITRKQDSGDVYNVCVLPSAECDTDHKLVRGKFKLRICKKVKVPKRINVSRHKQKEMCKAFSDKMDTVIFDRTWDDFKNQVYQVGVDLLGYVEKHHKELLRTKHLLHEKLLSKTPGSRTFAEKALKEHKAILQRELTRMKNEWWRNISNEVD